MPPRVCRTPTARYTYTPERLADGQRRYEQTPESLASIAADFGVHETTITRLAREKKWVRYAAPPRDLSRAAKLAAEARALVLACEAAMQQPPGEPASGNRPDLASIDESAVRIHATVLEELAAVEAMRRQLNAAPQRPADAERTAHTLTHLTRTVHNLQRIQHRAQQTDSAHDDPSADIDEFRRELARRIAAFMESRPDGEPAGDAAASAADEA